MAGSDTDFSREPFYLPFSRLLKRKFGRPVYKVTIDAGFTCPNIDGTRATGGCSFCDNTSFSPALRTGDSQIAAQIERGVKFYEERFGADAFLAYFQTFTNTHGPADQLRSMFREAMEHEKVVGISIGTRPDCVDEEKLGLVQELAERRPEALVCIEYGMQTMHDETGVRVNRAHSHAETIAAVELTRRIAPDVHLCLHLISGLPGEDSEMIRQSIDECARLGPDSIKFHHCYVYDNTRLADEFREGMYRPLELEEHVALAADCVERMPPWTAIQRLVGEINDPGVLAPEWGLSKMQVVQRIINELRQRGTHQSCRYGGIEVAAGAEMK